MKKKVVTTSGKSVVSAISPETKAMIDSAFEKAKQAAEVNAAKNRPQKFICPVCNTEYRYVLRGAQGAQYVHGVVPTEDGTNSKELDFCFVPREVVETTPTVKEMAEESLAKIARERAEKFAHQQLSHYFKRCLDKKLIHIYTEEDVPQKLFTINPTLVEKVKGQEVVSGDIYTLTSAGETLGYKIGQSFSVFKHTLFVSDNCVFTCHY